MELGVGRSPIRIRVGQVLNKFSGTLQKNRGSILGPKTPQLPVSKKKLGDDVTAKTVLKSELKKMQ